MCFNICILIALIVISTHISTNRVFANEFEVSKITQELSTLDLDDVETTLDDGTTFKETIINTISTITTTDIEDLASNIQSELLHLLTYEFKTQKNLILQLLLIVILSSILKQVSQSLSGKSVGDMGFFVCYMVLVIIIITSFYDISAMVLSRVDQISKTFITMIPIFITLSVINGSLTQGAFLGATIISGATFITYAIKEIILPTTLLTMSMEMADNFSDKPMLSRLVKFMKGGIMLGIKLLAMAFMLLTSLQKVGGDAINNVAIKTAKIAVETVPIVGDVMGGVVDTMAVFTGSLKSTVLIGVIVFLILLGLPIIIKLSVIYIIFKLTAGVSEFICEERLVDAISGSADYTKILIASVFLVQGLFIFSSIILLTFLAF